MGLPAGISKFLASVEKVADPFSGLRVGDALIPLHHPFWSVDEIVAGRTIKEDWDVPEDLVPFYGDWHELLCISDATGEIVLLDDERRFILVWKSTTDFLNCLTTDGDEQPPAKEGGSGVIYDQSWLDF
jgi:hypothetical protein